MRLGLLHSTIRGDEKLLLQAAAERNVSVELIDVRQCVFDPTRPKPRLDVVLERCVSTTLGSHALSYFSAIGIPTVNTPAVAQVCEDKFVTSLALWKNKVPTVPFSLVFEEEQAVEAVKTLGGYPVVLKPTQGSWGRLIAKLNDQDALEALIEHKHVLGTPPHKPLYLQKYIKKPERDIRVTVVGDQVVCAIYRETKHWITNTARGAEAKPCPVDAKLKKICLAASRAVGGGILGVDVFETEQGYVINEVNHTTEFKNVQRVTGVDVAGAMIEYCQKVTA